jgi:tripartite-type tricarboxylate transporter receptor subunit TctC
LESDDIKLVAVIGVDSTDPNIKDANALGVPELSNIKIVRMMAGPPGMSEDIKNTLEQAMLSSLDDPDFNKWLEATGNDAHAANSLDTTASVNEMASFYDRFKEYLD